MNLCSLSELFFILYFNSKDEESVRNVIVLSIYNLFSVSVHILTETSSGPFSFTPYCHLFPQTSPGHPSGNQSFIPPYSTQSFGCPAFGSCEYAEYSSSLPVSFTKKERILPPTASVAWASIKAFANTISI